EQVEKDIQEGHAKLEEYRNRAATTSKPALFRTDPAVAGEIRIIVSDSIEIVGCPLAVASEAFVQSAKDNYREALEYLSENPMQKFIAEYPFPVLRERGTIGVLLVIDIVLYDKVVKIVVQVVMIPANPLRMVRKKFRKM
ncbi:hypothetical protein F5880DRAFT_1510143, partial [Lentinula raphanica]